MNATTRRIALPVLTAVLLLLAALPLVARHAAAATDRGNDGIGVEDRGVSSQASADSDGDGATDAEEAAAGSDPTVKDTDGDGLVDGEEIGPGEPRPSPIDPDSDDDGLADGVEAHEYGTQPVLADTDGDGVKDGNEVAAGTDPLDPNSVPTRPDEGTTLAISKLLCPAGYDGKQHDEACTEPGQGIAFTVARVGGGFSETFTTDANGEVLFPVLGGGDYVIAEAIPRDVADILVRCSFEGSTEPRQIAYNRDGGIDLQIFENDTQGHCVWFNILAASGDEPAPTPQPTKPARPVTTLPDTGAGVVAGEDGGEQGLQLILGAGIALVLAGALWTTRRKA